MALLNEYPIVTILGPRALLYSRLDTRILIKHGKAAAGKDAIETQMIMNHISAIEFLVDDIDEAGFNRHTLLNLHSTL